MPPIPLFERLQIESHSHCNRSCWFCPRIVDRTGTYLDEQGAPVREQMPTALILDLLGQAKAMGFGGRVGFHHYSEPLLDPRHLDLAWAARERGLQPVLVTNGDVLRHHDALVAQVREAYAHIIVGLYDYTTEAEKQEAAAWWRVRLAGASLEFSAIGAGERGVSSLGIPRALLPPDRRMTLPDLVYRNAPCHRPLVRLVVQHNGNVAHCCEDLYGDFEIGNVRNASLEELWYGERHVQAVRDLIEGRREAYDLCRRCPLPPTGRPAEGRIDFTPRRAAIG
jgi:radical SAM protein with 4Fe4S-binding SPASM domain